MPIKVVVFDYDFTLYQIKAGYTPIWDDYTELMLKDIFCDLDAKSFLALKEKYSLFPPHSIEAVAKACLGEFNSADKLVQYMFSHPYRQDYENMEFVRPELIEKFSCLANLYIVSNSPGNAIVGQLEKVAGIDTTLFKGIITNGHNPKENDKSLILKTILFEENIEPQELIMVGDNQITDIEVAKSIGVKTYLTKSLNDLDRLYELLLANKI